MKKHFLIDSITAIFILLFVYAATSKWITGTQFKVQLGQSPLLTAFVPWVFWGIPLFELVAAGLLLFRRTWLTGMYLSFSLMILFTVYIIVIRYFSAYVPCSCGGILQRLNWQQHLWFNGVLTALLVMGILLHTPDRNTTSTHSNLL